MTGIKPPMQYKNVRLMPQEEMLEIQRSQKKLVIGIPKEIDPHESRIPLTPIAVENLICSGHEVIIERGAGNGANYTDLSFSNMGAKIVEERQIVFQSDVLIKVSPFDMEEISMLRNGQLIITAFNISSQSTEKIRAMMQKKITAIAFEYLKDNSRCYPIVRAMSEISGSTSILIAAEYLSNIHSGKGILLGGITGITPTEIVILGADTASEHAARTAIGLGAVVKVFDHSVNKLQQLQKNLQGRIITSVLHKKVLTKALYSADVVIGALQLLHDYHRFIVTEDMIQKMKPGSVIIDISIDQGGCFETSKLMNHSDPVFRKFGVLHYCVPNIASRVARTASIALSDIFAPLLLEIGNQGGVNNHLRENTGFRNGVYIYNGILTNSYIGEIFDIPYKTIELLMVALS